MDKARCLVEAHVLEGRSVSELAAAHGVHRSWIYKLLAPILAPPRLSPTSRYSWRLARALDSNVGEMATRADKLITAIKS